MCCVPRGKGFFLPWLTFHLWAGERGFFIKGLFGEEKLDFLVLFNVSSPRKRCESSQGRLVLRLDEGMIRLSQGVSLGVHVHLGRARGQERDVLVLLGEQ